MANEIPQTIARVRRTMPRNVDVMAICDELERLMSRAVPVAPTKRKLTRAEIQRNYRLRKKEQRR